jgi:RNA polymerase sigma-70 factor (ECF subfamily)
METERALPSPPSSLSRQLAVVGARQRGVGPEQLHWIATEPEVFEAFYREQVDDVLRFVARRVGERERAADLTAEIFLAAITSVHRYEPRRGTPKTWLFGIARVVVANDHRRAGREAVGRERLRAGALVDEDDAEWLAARIDAEAQKRELYEAMSRLSEPERAVLELVAIDEMTVAEAAAAVGVRPVTARVRLHRARRKLQAQLGAVAPDRISEMGDQR